MELDPDLATSAVMDTVKGLFHHWVFGEKGPPSVEAAAQVLDLLLDGLLVTGESDATA